MASTSGKEYICLREEQRSGMIALNLWFFPLWQVVQTFPCTGDG